jgi:hypothetical protein
LYRDFGVRAEVKIDAAKHPERSADQVQIGSISQEPVKPQPTSAGCAAMTSNGSLVFDDL